VKATPLDLDRSRLAAGWAPLADQFFASAAGQVLQQFLAARVAADATIFPSTPFTALELTPFTAVRVVVLGQDPYHGAGQAHGLAFSVPTGVKPPPSLRNIFLELQADLACPPPVSGELSHWARQGVLLLNAVLTVEEGQPASHARRGWERFTDALVDALVDDATPKVFMLWGAHAQAKQARVEAAGRHLVLACNHPSPLSARRPPEPFLGCRHFSRANAFLQAQGRGRIDWCRGEPAVLQLA
jgi:uracil-DNA glycosylase